MSIFDLVKEYAGLTGLISLLGIGFKVWIEKSIENKINIKLNRAIKIYERQFEFIPEIWEILQKSYGKAEKLVSRFKHKGYSIEEEIEDAFQAHVELHNYFCLKKIFLQDDLYDKVESIKNIIYDVISKMQHGYDEERQSGNHSTLINEARKRFENEAKPLYAEIEKSIKNWLWPR